MSPILEASVLLYHNLSFDYQSQVILSHLILSYLFWTMIIFMFTADGDPFHACKAAS